MTTSPNPDPRAAPSSAQAATRRRTLWVALGGLVLALLVLLGIGGCFAVQILRAGDGDAPSAGAAPDDDPAGTDDDPDDASDGPGTSWDDPAPRGDTARVPLAPGRAFEIAFGAPAWDVEPGLPGTGGEAPPEGLVYVQIPVTVTYRGEGAATYGDAVSMVYIDSTGTEYDEALGVTGSRPAEDLPRFSDATSAVFDVVFLLPAEEEGPGVIGLGPDPGDLEERVYVEVG